MVWVSQFTTSVSSFYGVTYTFTINESSRNGKNSVKKKFQPPGYERFLANGGAETNDFFQFGL